MNQPWRGFYELMTFAVLCPEIIGSSSGRGDRSPLRDRCPVSWRAARAPGKDAPMRTRSLLVLAASAAAALSMAVPGASALASGPSAPAAKGHVVLPGGCALHVKA